MRMGFVNLKRGYVLGYLMLTHEADHRRGCITSAALVRTRSIGFIYGVHGTAIRG